MILLDQAGAGTEGARIIAPSPMQLPWADHFWTQHTEAAPAGHSWRVIPELNPHLIFAVTRAGSRLQARCSLVGARSRFADVVMDKRVMTYGVCLRPDALPHLTRLPSSDFTDRSIPVEAVFGARGRSLLERLSEAAPGRGVLDTLAAFLAETWTGEARHASLPRLYSPSLQLEGCDRVEQLAVKTGLPLRTLHARLTQEIGLSPKRVLRIQRLHRALKLAQLGSSTWPEIAASAGFADQAHMIREFSELLGESPTAWRRRSALPIPSIPRATPAATLG